MEVKVKVEMKVKVSLFNLLLHDALIKHHVLHDVLNKEFLLLIEADLGYRPRAQCGGRQYSILMLTCISNK